MFQLIGFGLAYVVHHTTNRFYHRQYKSVGISINLIKTSSEENRGLLIRLSLKKWSIILYHVQLDCRLKLSNWFQSNVRNASGLWWSIGACAAIGGKCTANVSAGQYHPMTIYQHGIASSKKLSWSRSQWHILCQYLQRAIGMLRLIQFRKSPTDTYYLTLSDSEQVFICFTL